MENIIIGIDPDIEKNGVAVLYRLSKEISLHSLPFPQALTFIRSLAEKNNSLVVIVEAGWRNKSNFHLSPYDTKAQAAKKGVDQGRNHQRGIDIVEYLQYHDLKVIEMKPLPLMWGTGLTRKKISDEEIRRFMDIKKKRTNQEERDAALLAWVYAGLPMKA